MVKTIAIGSSAVLLCIGWWFTTYLVLIGWTFFGVAKIFLAGAKGGAW